MPILQSQHRGSPNAASMCELGLLLAFSSARTTTARTFCVPTTAVDISVAVEAAGAQEAYLCHHGLRASREVDDVLMVLEVQICGNPSMVEAAIPS